MAPSVDSGEVRHRQALTTEMTDALGAGLSPPLGGLVDIRANVRRAQVDATLEADELAEIASVLRSVAEVDRWLGRIGDQFPRLGALKQQVGEFSGVANAIDGCLDERGRVLDTASRRLSGIRREIDQVEQRIQETLRPAAPLAGDPPDPPLSELHDGRPSLRPAGLQGPPRGVARGSVHRTSASNETVYIEPQAIAEQSAQLSFLRAKESKEIRRILRWLSAQVGQVADCCSARWRPLAGLDLVLARGRYSLDYRLTAPDLNDEGG